ncbi:MAG TPA: transcription antitermination factor NusB [Rhodothermales bacterium]|nr:transcription antitermination factor NusB [Rhodothermales bacterium]
MSKRRQVRERVLQALYAQEVSGDEADHVLATLIRPFFADDLVALRFAEKLFLRALDAREDADTLLQTHVKNWELGRLALTDRLVVRLAVGEMLYLEDVPPKVTLNEALELAKAFSTEKSGSFVNGVLDAILKDLREAGRLHKTGRGLVDVSVGAPRKRAARAAAADTAAANGTPDASAEGAAPPSPDGADDSAPPTDADASDAS